MHNTNDNANDLDRYMDIVSEFSASIRNERADIARLEAVITRIRSSADNCEKMTTQGAQEIIRIKLEQLIINARIRSLESQNRFFQTAIDRRNRWM